MISASVKNKQDIRHGIRVLQLEATTEFSWKAGQYTRLTFGNFPPRPYSIANAPNSHAHAQLHAAPHSLIEIHVKDSGTNGASTYAVKHLKPGETVKIGEAEGESFYNAERDSTRPLLLIGGGLGVAPLKAIAEEALLNIKTAQPVYLYWGARQADDLYIADYFHGLAKTHAHFHFVPVIGGMVGESAAAGFDNLKGLSIFIAGPEALSAATIPLLLQKGAKKAHIHYDEFKRTTGTA